MSGAFRSRRSSHAVRVRYADTDQAAVVHHAAYLAFLEAARIEHFRAHGFDYAAFEAATRTGLPVVELRVRYRSPARFDDALEVETSTAAVTRFSMWIEGTVRRGDVVLVESKVRLACVDMGTERPSRLPRELLDACLEPGWEL
ncbi:MAG TPA: thioesterase family protein [Polyangiaceae bacterium]|nr:thioesterase family protein [Polyangiaceae bacterium]